MSWDPTRDTWWVVSNASDDVFQLITDGNGDLNVSKISHDVLVDPTSVHADDSGHVFVVAQGQMWEFEQHVDGTWLLVTDSDFADMTVGDVALLTRNRTNYEPDYHTGEGLDEVPPEAAVEIIVDCPPDLNFDRNVDVGDLLDVLAEWGPCSPDAFCHADLDYTGAVDVTDLLELLAQWGPCP